MGLGNVYRWAVESTADTPAIGAVFDPRNEQLASIAVEAGWAAVEETLSVVRETGEGKYGSMSTFDRRPARLPVDMLGRLTEARLGRRGQGRLIIAEGPHLDKRELLTGRFQTRAILHAEVSWGGQYGDLIGTLEAGVYAVTSRFTDLLLQSRMTGWKTYPLAVNRSDGLPAPLWLLAITGTCGPIYGVGGQPFAGMDGISQYLDPRQWDGSNLFLPDNRNTILVDDVAARLLRASGLDNVLVEPAGLQRFPGTGT